MGRRYLMLTLVAVFCTAVPTTDLVIPEKIDFAAYSTSASFIQAMANSGGTEVDCRTFAETTIETIRTDVTSEQKTLNAEDKGAECAQEGQTIVSSTQATLSTAKATLRPTSSPRNQQLRWPLMRRLRHARPVLLLRSALTNSNLPRSSATITLARPATPAPRAPVLRSRLPWPQLTKLLSLRKLPPLVFNKNTTMLWHRQLNSRVHAIAVSRRRKLQPGRQHQRQPRHMPLTGNKLTRLFAHSTQLPLLVTFQLARQ